MTPFDAAIELIVAMERRGVCCPAFPAQYAGWKCPKSRCHEDMEFAKCLRAYCEWRAKEVSHD